MNRPRGPRLAAFSSIMIVPLVVGLAVAASSAAGGVRNTVSDAPSMHVSTSAARSPARSLSGAALRGEVYIFVRAPRTTSRVEFLLDSSTDPFSVDDAAPFDLVPTSRTGKAHPLPLATDRLTVGQHTLTAIVTDGKRRRRTVARFNVVGSPTVPTTLIAGAPPSTAPPSTVGVVVPPRWPGPSDTGVPSGFALRPSPALVVTTPGTVIDGLDIDGTLTIKASNVTVRRTRVRGSGAAIISVSEGATGVVIEQCEIDGLGDAGEGNSSGVVGPVTLRQSNIHRVENGVVPYSGSVIEGNYVHDLAAPGDPHYDGIQIDGGVENVVIAHNTVLNRHNQTAAVMINNYFGPVSNIRVENNRLVGGGYTVYSDGQFSGGPISRVRFLSNRLVRGQWGYGAVRGNVTESAGNVDDVTGAAVELT